MFTKALTHIYPLTQNSARSETMSEIGSDRTKGDWSGLSHGADKDTSSYTAKNWEKCRETLQPFSPTVELLE